MSGNKIKTIAMGILLVLFHGTAHAQAYTGKLVIAYEQFHNAANVAGDAVSLEFE